MTDDDQVERSLQRYRVAGPPASLEARILAAAQSKLQEQAHGRAQHRAGGSRASFFPWLDMAFPVVAAVLVVATLSLVHAADQLTAHASASLAFEATDSLGEIDQLVRDEYGLQASTILRWQHAMTVAAPKPPPVLPHVAGMEEAR